MTRAARPFLAYFHLPVTGNLGLQTLKLVRQPRRGVRDIPEGVD